MKIGLIGGSGKTGKEIVELAKEKGVVISEIFDIDRPFVASGIDNRVYDFDVLLDFSVASAVVANVELAVKLQRRIIIGTTGWYGDMDKVKSMVGNSIGCVWSSNFSIGMQIYYKVLAEMTQRLEKTLLYDVFVSEKHHKNKADSPSGTALEIGKIILDNLQTKDTLQIEQLHRAIYPNELHISALRGGDIFGTHSVTFDSAFDTIELIHQAKNRRGFAEGALLAAELINGKLGFYEFGELL